MSLALEILPPEKRQPLKRIVTIDDVWAMHVKLRGTMARNTREIYDVIGRLFCNFMREKRLSKQSIAEWVININESGRKSSTIGLINGKVRAFLKFLRRMGYTHDDLSEIVPYAPVIYAKEPAMFTEYEYEKIKAYCTGRNWCQVHLWLIILGYRTGMSLVDCCFLRWCQVHLNDNSPSFIDIHRIKTQRLGQKALCQIPVIPFTDVHDWLLRLKAVEHLNYQRHDGIKDFVHQDASGFYQCTFSRIQQDFKNIFMRAGVQGKTFRNLRNSFCSNLVNSGTQLALVCKMTGHNNVAMLLRYLKADRRALQDGLSKSFQYSAANAGVGKGSDPLMDQI